MSTVAILREQILEVEPGYEVSCQLSVYNASGIVEQFTIEVLGDTADWSEVTPSVLSLFPNTQQDVTVTFAPPREWHVPQGSISFGVRITAANDPEASVVEEGTLVVGHFADLSAELIPQVAVGRRGGRLGIAIDHRGNAPFPAELRGRDPADALLVTIKPNRILLEPGQAAFAKVKVAPRKRYLRGPTRQTRFKIFVEPSEGDFEPVVLDATLIQKPLLPKGSVGILGIVFVLLLWFVLIRPVVKNTAVSAVSPSVSAQQQANAAVQQSLANTNSSVSALNQSVSSVASADKSSTTTATTVLGTTPTSTATTVAAPQNVTNPLSNSLQVVAAPGSTNTGTVVLPKGSSLSIQDLIVQNEEPSPSGQVGNSEAYGGEVRVERLPAGSSTALTLLAFDQSNLTEEDYRFQQPVIFNPGDTFEVLVSCGSNRPACQINVYYGGTETAPATTTTAGG